MKKTRIILDDFHIQTITPEYIAKRIDDVRKFVTNQIDVIQKMNQPIHQMLVLFPLLEAFAQEYANYPNGKESSKAFVDFILRFQRSYDFLNDVDPVTLFYDCEKELDGCVNLEGFSIGSIFFPTDSKIRDKTNEILACLEKRIPEKKDIYINRHRYINLLYRLRSKLIHEMTTPFSIINEYFEDKFDIPQYWHRSLLFPEDGVVLQKDDWTLHIPVVFIEHLALECIDGFLQFCNEKQRDPASNNKVTRKFYLSWYDY